MKNEMLLSHSGGIFKNRTLLNPTELLWQSKVFPRSKLT